MTKIKKTDSERLIVRNQERFSYYSRLPNMVSIYNYAKIEGGNFLIYRKKDNELLIQFNTKTFLPV